MKLKWKRTELKLFSNVISLFNGTLSLLPQLNQLQTSIYSKEIHYQSKFTPHGMNQNSFGSFIPKTPQDLRENYTLHLLIPANHNKLTQATNISNPSHESQ